MPCPFTLRCTMNQRLRAGRLFNFLARPPSLRLGPGRGGPLGHAKLRPALPARGRLPAAARGSAWSRRTAARIPPAACSLCGRRLTCRSTCLQRPVVLWSRCICPSPAGHSLSIGAHMLAVTLTCGRLLCRTRATTLPHGVDLTTRVAGRAGRQGMRPNRHNQDLCQLLGTRHGT
jgi:hypothetical protein